MKGIIWRKSSESEAAEILFEQIIMNYNFMGINGQTIKSKDSMRFKADNGDYWEVLSARESFRGKKCIRTALQQPAVTCCMREVTTFV